MPDPGASWADADGDGDDETTEPPVGAVGLDSLEVVERGAPGGGFGGTGREQDSFAMEDEGSEEVALDPRLNLKAEPATEIIDRDRLAALASDDDIVTLGPVVAGRDGAAEPPTIPQLLPLGTPDPKTEVIRRDLTFDPNAADADALAEMTVPTSLPTLAEIERDGAPALSPGPYDEVLPEGTGPTPQDLLALPPPEPGDGSYAIDIGFARPPVRDDHTVPVPLSAVRPRPGLPGPLLGSTPPLAAPPLAAPRPAAAEPPAPSPAPSSNTPELADPPSGPLRGEDAATIAIQAPPAAATPDAPPIVGASVPVAGAPSVSPLVGVLALVGSGGVLAVALVLAVAVAIGGVVVLTLDAPAEAPETPAPLPPIELEAPVDPEPPIAPEPEPEGAEPVEAPAPTRRRAAPAPEPVEPAPAPAPAPEPVVAPPPPPPPEPVEEDDKKRGLFRKKK